MNADEIRAGYQAGIHLIPQHMRPGMLAYIERGQRPGGFMSAWLSGDMEGARHRADPTNVAAWKKWATFGHDHLSTDCHNTPQKFEAWIAKDGLKGHTG